VRLATRAAVAGALTLTLASCGSGDDESIAMLEAQLEDAEQRADEAEAALEDAEAELADVSRDQAEDADAANNPDPDLPALIGEPIQAGDLQVTVHEFERPAEPSEASLDPDPGNEHVVLDAEVCVTGDLPLEGVTESNFRLIDADGGRWEFWNVQTYARSPRFPTFETVQPDDCVRGWVTFEVREDVELIAVDVEDYLTGGNRMRWALDG
jgi:hypothetical protein